MEVISLENNSETQKFLVSIKELKRREIAFFSLLTSLLIGLFVGESVLNLQILYLGTAMLGVLFVLLIIFLHRFFKSIESNFVSISEENFIRCDRGKFSEYQLKDVAKIHLKLTTKKTLREIGIFFKNGKVEFINGIDDFDRFSSVLKKSVSKDVVIKEIFEPLDFDHPIFYPILGIILSIFGILFLKLLLGLNWQVIKIIFSIISLFLFILAGYFFSFQPIAKRYGRNRKLSDWALGGLFVIAGVFTVVLVCL